LIALKSGILWEPDITLINFAEVKDNSNWNKDMNLQVDNNGKVTRYVQVKLTVPNQ